MFELVDYKNAADWSIDEVGEWLTSKDYPSYIAAFKKEKINGRALILLNEDDLKQMVKSMGDRKNLSFHIKSLKIAYCSNNFPVSRQNSISPTDSIHQVSGHICENCLKKINLANTDPANDLLKVSQNLKSSLIKAHLANKK